MTAEGFTTWAMKSPVFSTFFPLLRHVREMVGGGIVRWHGVGRRESMCVYVCVDSEIERGWVGRERMCG